MSGTIKLLFQVLVVQFYKLNSGFFLFIFLLLFGIVEPGQLLSYHVGLMQLILSSVAGMGLAMIAWVYYGYKCASYVLHSLDQHENSFLINLQGWPLSRQWVLFLYCQVIIYLPILVYAGIAISLGFQSGLVAGAIIIFIFQVLICLGSTYLYCRKLNSFHIISFKLNLDLPFTTQISKPSVLYLVYHILYERKIVWLALKVFSSFIFYLVFVLHKVDFSLGYFRLLFLIATIAHSMLVFFCFEFTEKQMAFTRNLPITRTYRLLTYLITYVILLLPELCWMVIYAGNILSWPEMLLTLSVGLVQLLLITALLYLPGMQLERFALTICSIYFLTAILLSTSVTLILITEVVLALIIFYRNYYTFEYNAAKS